MNTYNRDGVIRIKQLTELLCRSRATIYRLLKRDPGFPRPFRMSGSRSKFWRVGDVLDYINRSADGGSFAVVRNQDPKRPNDDGHVSSPIRFPEVVTLEAMEITFQ